MKRMTEREKFRKWWQRNCMVPNVSHYEFAKMAWFSAKRQAARAGQL